MLLELTVSEQDPAVVTLTGELDMSSSGQLSTMAAQLLEAGRFTVVIDLSALQFCDSSGLAQFILLHHQCTGGGGVLRLAEATSEMQRILRITDLDHIIPTFPTVAAARPGAS